MKSIYSIIRNPLYNLGHHGKNLEIYSESDNFYVLVIFLEYCPNVQTFSCILSKDLLRLYIVCTKRKRRGSDMENLKGLDYGGLDINNSTSCCLRVFRNSLIPLHFNSVPDNHNMDSDNSKGTE
jgi:hypothetical protein